MANTIELKQQIQQGAYDAAFVKLYGADVDVNAQRERYISVIDQFENEFGSGRSVRLYSAPGRTEIGGNHTDHNNGAGGFRQPGHCGGRFPQRGEHHPRQVPGL